MRDTSNWTPSQMDRRRPTVGKNETVEPTVRRPVCVCWGSQEFRTSVAERRCHKRPVVYAAVVYFSLHFYLAVDTRARSDSVQLFFRLGARLLGCIMNHRSYRERERESPAGRSIAPAPASHSSPIRRVFFSLCIGHKSC